MKINKRKNIISVLSVFALLLITGSGHAASVNVDGWTFTADLGDQWRSDSHPAENDDTMGWNSGNGEYNWKGVCLWNAFWLPQENANVNPEDLPEVLSPTRNELLANVGIRVHKVPKDVQNWDAQAILDDFCGTSGSSSCKEIEFNDRPALLIEDDYDSDAVNNDGEVIMRAGSTGGVYVLITEDTVVSIDVVTRKESGLRASDVIDMFDISPK